MGVSYGKQLRVFRGIFGRRKDKEVSRDGEPDILCTYNRSIKRDYKSEFFFLSIFGLLM